MTIREGEMGRYKQNYTLFKRGKYWYYRTYDREGVRTSAKTTGCKLKSEAKIYCDKLYQQGSLWSSNKPFKDYAEHFFDDNSTYLLDRVEPLSKNTLNQYRSTMQKQLLPYFQDIKLCDITLSCLKQYRTKLLQDDYKIKSINSIMTIMKIIMTNAHMERLIFENPFQFIKPLKNNSKGRDAFSLEEVKKLIAELPQYKDTILLIALTGMRRTEAGGVTVADIKNKEDLLYIDLNKQYSLGKYSKLKTKKARIIPVIPELKNIIRTEPMEMYDFSAAITEIKDKFNNAEERLLCLHSLRHFFITDSKSFGINPLIVETIAGHSLKGMQQVYTNFNLDNLSEILEWQKKTFIELNK